ncbi:MAG: hypothetical protein MJ177_00340 [Clostridia bacterium]|nr:hypothetical protein [Clostridia bacterium]
MVNIREIEPFAFGFKEADVSGIQKEYERNYRIACGFKRLVETAKISIDPDEWFAGPGCTYPDLGIHYSRSAGLISHPDLRNDQKERYPSLADEIDALYDEFEPIRTHRITGGTFTERQHSLRRVNACWGEGAGHANPDYELLLRVGTDGIREKIALFRKIHTDKPGFYDSLEVALSAIEILAARYQALAKQMLPDANEKDAAVLHRIISAFDNIPQKQPRNFFEACQFFWLSYSFIENDSPGLFDFALGRYYENDDEEDRYECLKKLWHLFKKVRAWNLCIGGSDELWRDRCCALTYDVLRVARETGYNTPNITMRFHRNSPQKAWIEAAKTIGTGIGMPAIYNDECVCPALEAVGIPASDSHLYCMNGCNQIDIFGKSHMGLEDGEISIIKALEFALFDGECQISFEKLGLNTGDAAQFAAFDELLKAYYAQAEFLLDNAIDMSLKCQRVFAAEAPNPWHSLVIQGCIEKGLDYKNRGPYYGHGQILTEGLPDTADSLAAIKHYVYDEKKYTMAQLLDALKKDFEGYDELYKDFSSYHKFGNDIEDVDEIYNTITEHIYRYAQTKETFRGGKFGMGCSTFQRAARYGGSVGALPNGKRRNDTTLADSIGAVPGCDVNGPTALLCSVLKCNQRLALSGNVLQMKFQKIQFNTEKGLSSFISLAKTYFNMGGQTLQINVLDKNELIAAQKEPEKYKNLIVRVGGYSTQFVDIEKGLQDNIIKRTEQMM